VAGKKSLKALAAYASYCAVTQKKAKQKPLDFLVLDEIYTYLGAKSKRLYIWTGIGFSHTGEKLVFFHVDTTHGITGLLNFQKVLPKANTIHCDGNPAYPWVYGTKCIPGKGVKTNLVESFNSQLRQYVSRIKRKTKAYAKDMDALRASIALVLIGKVF
jgi:IS1 family transposase